MQIPTLGLFWDSWSSITIVGLVPVVLMLVLLIWIAATKTGRARTLSLVGLPIPIFYLIRQITLFALLRPFLDWAWMIHFASFGIYPYFVALYVTILAFPNLLSERKWVAFVALIGPIAYELATFIDVGLFASSTTLWTEFVPPTQEGYAVYMPHVPHAYLVTTLVYLTVYLVIVPLYAVYRYTRLDRIRGTPRAKWVWLALIGLLLWFIADALTWGGWLVQTWAGWEQFWYSYTDHGWAVIVGKFEALLPAAVSAISWYIIFIGMLFMQRSSTESTA